MQIVIESIDRLGKDSLIQGLLKKYGYHLVIHHSSPVLSEVYKHPSHQNIRPENLMLRDFQYDAFSTSLELIAADFDIIFNRSWLGEYVYAKRYRNYSGDYVFHLEQQYEQHFQSTYLILLYTDDFGFLEDDGKSLDFTKRKEEMDDFVVTFERSVIPHKIMINVHNGSGSYKTYNEILTEVITFLETAKNGTSEKKY